MNPHFFIAAAARTAALLCLLGVTLPGLGALAAAQPAADAAQSDQNQATQLETARQLLDWLGVDAIVEQTPQIAEQALQSEARRRNASAAELAQWRRDLNPPLNATTLRERVVRGVAAELDAATLQRALTRLQMPLPRRARYFELALAQPGSGQGLKDFRAQFDAAPDPARRQLAKQLVEVSGAANLVAYWQTAIATEVGKLAGGPIATPADAVHERTLYLTPLAEAHALYTYRFLTNDELGTYRDTLGDAAVQAVLAACRSHLLNAFSA